MSAEDSREPTRAGEMHMTMDNAILPFRSRNTIRLNPDVVVRVR
jgi:hypothetical protein